MLADIAAATSSVHINQFGFRPGTIGESFAEALLAKAGKGWRSGWSSTGRARHRRRARESSTSVSPRAGSRSASSAPRSRGPRSGRSVAAETRAGTSPPSGTSTTASSWSSTAASGWVGGAGIEDHFNDGRFHDLFLRVTGPVVAQLQLVFLASFRWLGGRVPAAELDGLFPSLEPGGDPVPGDRPPQRARPLPADHRRDRGGARRRRARPSTSSTRTSPTAG